MDGGQLQGAASHRACFSCLRASMAGHGQLSETPELRRVFRKLFQSAEALAGAGGFAEEEARWLREYALLAITRCELHTDDSFLFSKKINALKANLEALEKHPAPGESGDLQSFRMETLVSTFSSPLSLPHLRFRFAETDNRFF